MRGALLLLAKDLRLLVRSPGLLAVLVLYPLVIGVLVAGALQQGDRRAQLAVVNLDTGGRTVEVAGERLSVDDYIARLGDDAHVTRMDAEEADRALGDGRVDAVITIPPRFVADLQSGLRSPVIRLTTGRRSPLGASALERRAEAAVFRLNGALARGYVDQVVALVDFVINGGRLGVFGRPIEALGLVRARALVVDLQAELRRRDDAATARRLDPLITFIDATRRNLDLAAPAAGAIRAPIELAVTEDASGRGALSGYGVAAALLVGIGLAGVLLGAAGIAVERDDGVLARLGRGPVRPWVLVAEKMALTAIVCVALGLIVLGAVALVGDVTVGRWPVWVAALALIGFALGGLGTLAGALAGDTRTAMLAAFMLTVPLAALALLPAGGPAEAIGAAAPFGPGFDIARALLADPVVDGAGLALDMVTLGVMAVVLGAAAAVFTARRARA